ncbi:MAG TPA: hypothetical protein VGJ59_22155 [Jatrophihabitantaceae bacterium]
MNDESARKGRSQPATKHSALTVTRIGGMNALVLLLPVPDDAPELVREGLARRNIVNTGGTCPCGAVLRLPNLAARRAGVTDLSIVHEDDCPATDENVLSAIRRWGR